MTTPRTCPHCHEPVEPHHGFCGACSFDMSGGSAPLSLLGEHPQVYGSMGAYYREPSDQPTFRGVGEKRQPGEHEFAPRWDHDKNRCITRCLYCQLPEREWSGDTPCAGEKEK